MYVIMYMCIHMYTSCHCFYRTIGAIAGYEHLDFATTILTFFLVNVMLFLSLYVLTKVIYMYSSQPNHPLLAAM